MLKDYHTLTGWEVVCKVGNMTKLHTNEHGDIMKYLCMICGKEFAVWSTARRHNEPHGAFIATFANTANNTGFKPWGDAWLNGIGRNTK